MQQSSVKHNPLTFYLRLLLYMFLALLIRLAVLAPLAALFAFPQGSPWRWLAVLCPVLLLFFLLPQRFSFAEALVQKPHNRYFSFDQALSMKGYGEKLLESLLHALNLLKWALPLLAMGCYAVYCKDNVDAKTLMMALINMGKTASSIVYAISSFFVSLFGHLPSPQVAGGLMEGVYVLLAILGVGVLILLIGAVRNSATRYIWVVAEREERPVRTEVRRRLRGRRWRQLGVGLINLALWAPFLVVVALSLKDALGDLSTQVMLLMANGAGGSLNLAGALAPLIAAFFLLYMPLLPARRILTAAFATHNARHTVVKQPEAAPAQPQSMAYVPDWVKAANEAAPADAAPVAPSFAAAKEEPAVEQPTAAEIPAAAPAAPAAAQAVQEQPTEYAEGQAPEESADQPGEYAPEQPAASQAADAPAPYEEQPVYPQEPETMTAQPETESVSASADPWAETSLSASENVQPDELAETEEAAPSDPEEHFFSPDEETEAPSQSRYNAGLDA